MPDLSIAVQAYSMLDANARARALLDDFHPSDLAAGGSLLLGRGRIAGRSVHVAATDRRVSGGTFGAREGDALAHHLRAAVKAGEPVLLMLDSAGARIDGGLPALGAFRRLYAAALSARIAGLPLLAVLGRDCFGGASMLAMLCGARIATPASRLGMSGPSIVEATAGRSAFDASDKSAVAALFGAGARARTDSALQLCEDNADSVRAALPTALEHARSVMPLESRHRLLGERLLAAGASIDMPERPFAAGRPNGAADCWSIAARCIAGEALPWIELDSPGQKATPEEERLLLSEYVAHLALCLASLGARAPLLRITGEAAGGIYVALAAPARRVGALGRARVRLLPPDAEERVLGAAQPDATLEDALAAGVIDELSE